VMQGKHAETSLATAEANGENRARDAVQKLLEHPLVENSHLLAEASAVLVCIAAGPGLSMAEVNRIMEQINRHCEHAHIIMGAAIHDELGDNLSLTLLASSPNRTPDEASSAAAESALIEHDDRAISAAISTRPGQRRVVIPAPPHELSAQPAGPIPAPGGRMKKQSPRMRQGQLPLEVLSKGRFEKSEPTIYHGQDLDVPTYIRRGIPLN
jgi:cell division protein FtsZ